MKFRHIVLTSIVALSASGAMAQDVASSATQEDAASATRAQVKESVLKARSAHELRPAGPQYEGPPSHTSTVSRSQVKGDVIAARVAGELTPAGEGVGSEGVIDAGVSLASRAEVKAQVIAARKAGELVPAGEAVTDVAVTHRSTASNESVRHALARAFGRQGSASAR